MGILSSVKTRIKLAKLREEVKKDPSPAALGKLAQYYIHMGDNASAYKLVEKGLKEFVDSEILENIRNYIRKSRFDGRSRQALKSLEDDPSPDDFVTVISAYRDLDDIDTAERYTASSSNSFPPRRSRTVSWARSVSCGLPPTFPPRTPVKRKTG